MGLHKYDCRKFHSVLLVLYIEKYFPGWILKIHILLAKKVKVNLSMSLINETLCHGDIWGNGLRAPPFLTSASGQLHAPTVLPPGKQPPVPIGQEAGWSSEPVWTLWRRENLPSAGNRTPTIQPVARRFTDWAIPASILLAYFHILKK
jgi:hypothetical protein